MSDPIRRILLTTDGSKASEAVIPAILPLVRAFNPEVLLLHVFEDLQGDYLLPAGVVNAHSTLRKSGVNTRLRVREGAPAEQILLEARMKKVDVIAMSTQGRGGVARMIGGSVAEEVLRRSEVPVLITRRGMPVPEGKAIAVALDGSERAEEILPDVVRLARTLNARVDVIQVAVPVVTGMMGDGVILLPPENPMPYLTGVVGRLKAQGVQASAVALDGPAALELVRHLETSKPSLLCMTTHGRSGLSRLLLGSVAEAVVRKAPCPVLLHRIAAPKPSAEAPAAKGVTIY